MIYAPHQPFIKKYTQNLYEQFKWKSFRTCNWFLGYAVKQNQKEILIDQCIFLDNLLKSFKQFNIKSANNFAFTNLLTKLENDKSKSDFPYFSLVGSLNWLTKTWPDIFFAVSQCSQYLHNHSSRYDKAALRIFEYLKKFSNYKLNFLKLSENERKDLFFYSYSDSSYTNCSKDCCSSYGYIIKLNERSIFWWAKKSNHVCLSNCKAKYHTISETTKEVNFVENLLSKFEMPHNQPAILNIDFKPTKVIANIPCVTQRNKHFDIKDHYIQSKIVDETLELKYTPTAENLADIFTKPLPPAKLNLLRENILSQCATGDQ